MSFKSKKNQLNELKKSILNEYKYRIKCKSCSGEILNLKESFENDPEWSLISESYYYDTLTLNIINYSYVYYNKASNKAAEFVISNDKSLAYFRYLKNKDFSKYYIPKQIIKK